MNLITTSSVNPTILNGRRISQTRGNNTSITMAIGQHSTSSRHQRINPINILMAEQPTKLSPYYKMPF
jgi:hypothetical protein